MMVCSTCWKVMEELTLKTGGKVLVYTVHDNFITTSVYATFIPQIYTNLYIELGLFNGQKIAKNQLWSLYILNWGEHEWMDTEYGLWWVKISGVGLSLGQDWLKTRQIRVWSELCCWRWWLTVHHWSKQPEFLVISRSWVGKVASGHIGAQWSQKKLDLNRKWNYQCELRPTIVGTWGNGSSKKLTVWVVERWVIRLLSMCGVNMARDGSNRVKPWWWMMV